MRPTWLILGLIVLVGAVAYIKLVPSGEAEPAPPAATQGDTNATPSLARTTEDAGPPPAGDGVASAASVERQALEATARGILGELSAAHQAKDRNRYDAAVARLKAEAWDAPSARQFAVKLGWSTLKDAEGREGADRMRRLDQARRLLSRGVYLDEAFAANGHPTQERQQLIAAIQKANHEVMNWGRREGGGLEGITRAYEVPPGWAPVIIVSREKLPYGHNALLYWNHAGDLDPRRLRAGEVLLLPEEPLSVEVHLARRRLGLYLGDWFVKEFRVGVGREDRPTPTGTYQVGSKMENPDWWGPNGHVEPLHPKNELGTAWIPFFSDTLPISAGFGIHGTNRPDTVGSRCSNGCVRLVNDEASELFWWVRTGSAGGPATRVVIRPYEGRAAR